MTRNDSTPQTGGVNDPVAQNIRNQQNRDAMPTQKEAKAAARKALASKGCSECGEDDPDVLDQYHPLQPSCSARQQRHEPVILCDDCHENRETLRERALRRAREKDDDQEENILAVAFYGCDVWRYVEEPTIDMGNGEEIPASEAPPHVGERPTAPIECRCGSELDDIVYLD